MVLLPAVEAVIIFRPGPPAELQLRQGLAWHTRRRTKHGRETKLGPITRYSSDRPRERVSQAEALVPRFSTLLLGNRQAQCPPVVFKFPSDGITRQSPPGASPWSESEKISAESDTLSTFFQKLRIRPSDIRIGISRCVALIASYPAGTSHFPQEGRARHS
jgi:hypothetical protein